ncbi:hypothetical protein SAMN05192551_101467 [Tindallia magadiensis]|uniref:Circadian input-output histidine kinase CikA n=1 Tax=Tindallia magadiensis TaxID=69895 RepID=A0A1I3AYS0_9FIRM|nr:PAS domain-containing hybrid sensor histidine kinase/response regulator [Tindallia magadiensis]SFH54869.1 hypothetical protein SAMN05192551_101467 [Tindallia magadiensis]
MNKITSQNKKFNVLMDDLPVMICEFLPDTTLTYVNRAYCCYFNKRQDELLGKSFLTVLPKNLHEEAKKTLLLLTPEAPVSVHIQKTERNGEIRWEEWRDRGFFDDKGKAIKYQSAAIDITDRINAEKMLKKQKEKYQQILENMTDVIWQTDLTLKLTFVTPSVYRLIGEKSEEHMNKPIEKIFPSESLEILKKTLEEELMRENTFGIDYSRTRLLELQQFHKTKGCIWVSMHISFIRNEQGVPIGLQGVSRDITETKKMQEELLIAKKKAENAIEVKSRFLANMSHEIRTPLNGILGMLQLLEMEDLKGEQREIIELAKKSGSNLIQLINEVLDFSKAEAGKKDMFGKPFNIRNLMQEIEVILIPEILSKGLDFKVEISDDLPEVIVGDSLRLKQVFTNLVHNAVKFTDNGRIDVKIEKVMEKDETYLLKCLVRDTGIGIPETKKDQIFDVFSQANEIIFEKYGGTGLGLSITKKIIEDMNGTIWVESIEGEGSWFYFTCEVNKNKDRRMLDTTH